MPEEQVLELLRRTGMPVHTEHTITDPDAFTAALRWVDEHGYAIDDEEQEHGVRCVAVAVPDGPSKLGLSVSGPATRMTPQVVERAVPILRDAAAALSRDLA
jgi:IclR family acetate operon transcriptional repressor